MCCFSETAINIGYSCKLLTDEMEEIYIVDGESYEAVEAQLKKARDEMVKINREGGTLRPTENNIIGGGGMAGGGGVGIGPRGDAKMEVISFSNGAQSAVSDVKLGPNDPAFGGFALVINGHSLVS